MELDVPPAFALVVGLALLGLGLLAACLVDLSRRQVRHLPKWAWALIIMLVSFPLGAIIYVVVGRVPPGEEPTSLPSTPAAPVPAAPPSPGAATPAPPSVMPSAPAPGPKTADAPPIVVTSGLGKRYDDADALVDVDLEVPHGAIYGLIGPNGAGKTTLLSILAGLRRPTAGHLEVSVARQRIGVLVDTPQFEPWLSAREVVDLARQLTAPQQPAERVDEVLDGAGLGEVRDRRCGGFSRGMLQRLGLAAALVADPEVLLLDEPSSALDPAGRREVLDLIGRLAGTTTVLLSTHILADVQAVCDVVGVIDHGRLRYQGPMVELLARTSSAYALHVRGPADGLLADLRARAWVDDVAEQAPGRLRLVVTDAPRAEREIPTLVAHHELALASFVPATDLETAFLELTS